jgi:hypothetical protein
MSGLIATPIPSLRGRAAAEAIQAPRAQDWIASLLAMTSQMFTNTRITP